MRAYRGHPKPLKPEAQIVSPFWAERERPFPCVGLFLSQWRWGEGRSSHQDTEQEGGRPGVRGEIETRGGRNTKVAGLGWLGH